MRGEIYQQIGLIQYSENKTYRLYIIPDGVRKYRLYFLEGHRILPKNHSEVVSNNLPFILFSENTSQENMKILGMYVPVEYRGKGFSNLMLSRFFQIMYASERKIGPTGQIKKPLLAAKLSNIGFIPERSDIIARIIGVNQENIPQVVLEENFRAEGTISPKNKSSTGMNTFYDMVSSDVAPPNTGRRIAIQTIYLPPGENQIQSFIDTASLDILGKVRIYPSRVNKILDGNTKK